MRRRSSVYGTALIFCVAAALPVPSRADIGPAVSAQIDAMAKAQIHAGRTPGIAIGIIQDGRIVYARGFGFADVSRHIPMAPDTEFDAGGLTMQFTAAAILLLAQDGKLSLDDRVTKYVPELHSAANVTVGELLTQTSGLPDYSRAPGSPDLAKPVKLSSLLAAAAEAKASSAPGTAYANNPLNYIVAGLIVERASGVSLSDFLEQRIFIPLIMDHSFLAGDNGIASRAIGYTRGPRGFVLAQSWDPVWMAGNAGLVSTIYDLAKWDIEMPILLRVDAVRTMFAPSASSGLTRYGMGWVIDRRGGKDFVWSDGELPGYRAMSALLPEQHVGVIVLSNADSLHGATTIPEEFGARILDLVVPPTAARLDNAIVMRAREWLTRLASRHLERGELTPAFDAYLTDDLIARENLASLGPLLSIVPISSTAESNGNTLYEFLVRYKRAQYHYEFELTSEGKIDGISLRA